MRTVMSSEDAYDHASRGIKVRQSTWPKDEYVVCSVPPGHPSYDIDATIIVDEKGLVAGGYKLIDVNDNALWEEFEPTACVPSAGTAYKPGQAPMVHRTKEQRDYEIEYAFRRDTKNPDQRCECGSQHTGEPHSDWCQLSSLAWK